MDAAVIEYTSITGILVGQQLIDKKKSLNE